tara:strand:+ start:1368 stop:1739 length:372 start_codon:yes stop_codon:yes gene_type:complete
MKVFLDDVRTMKGTDWVIARNFEGFKGAIGDYQTEITLISFDHDLGKDTQNGLQCANWLVNSMEGANPTIRLPALEAITIHSSNPPGSEGIMAMFTFAKKYGIIPDTIRIIRLNTVDLSDVEA